MSSDPPPVRMTGRRALALLAVFEVGAKKIEQDISDRLRFARVLTAEEIGEMRVRDEELAQARSAAAIFAHRYAGAQPPAEAPSTSLF